MNQKDKLMQWLGSNMGLKPIYRQEVMAERLLEYADKIDQLERVYEAAEALVDARGGFTANAYKFYDLRDAVRDVDQTGQSLEDLK